MGRKTYFSLHKEHCVAVAQGRNPINGQELPPVTFQFNDHLYETADQKLQKLLESTPAFDAEEGQKVVHDITGEPQVQQSLKSKYFSGAATTATGPGAEAAKEADALKQENAQLKAKVAELETDLDDANETIESLAESGAKGKK